MDKLFRIRSRVKLLLGHKVCIKIGKRYGGGRWTNVDTNNADTPFVQVKKSGSAAPQGVAVCALRHPSLPDQLLSDYGNRAPLQPGMSCQSLEPIWHDIPGGSGARFP